LIFALVIAIPIIVLIIINIRNTKKLQDEGILAEATILDIKIEEYVDEDGTKTTIKTYFITFRNERGEWIETKLIDANQNFEKNQKIMIKYLDSNPKKVIVAKENN
jgi:hypothetical protein